MEAVISTADDPGQPDGAGPRYRRAPHLALTWEDGSLTCMSGVTGRSYRLPPDLVSVLDAATGRTTAAQLAEQCRVSPSIVARLAALDLLQATDPVARAGTARLDLWSTVELAMQRRTGRGSRRTGLNYEHAPAPLSELRGERVPLPVACSPKGDRASFGEVLRRRRSIRHFSDHAVVLEDLAELLVGAAGLQRLIPATASSRRPYPSGGARHPLELFVVATRIDRLGRGSYHFDPRGVLVRVATEPTFEQRIVDFVRQAAEVDPAGNPPSAVVLITSCFERTLWRYHSFGLSVIYKDVGCLLQTLYLQATALGLAGYAVGGGPEAAIATALGLDPVRQSYVGAFVLGAPAGDPLR